MRVNDPFYNFRQEVQIRDWRQLARSSEGDECFFSSGIINAVLYEDGKVPVERERFTIVVMGFNSTGKRDLKSEAGISSRGQDELVAARMFRLISSDVAGGWRGECSLGIQSRRKFRAQLNKFVVKEVKERRSHDGCRNKRETVGRMG